MPNSSTIKLFNEVLKKIKTINLYDSIQKDYKKPLTLTNLQNLIINSKNPFIFLMRYPKEILKKLNYGKLLSNHQRDKYRSLLESLDIDVKPIEETVNKNKINGYKDYFIVLLNPEGQFKPLLDDITKNFFYKDLRSNSLYIHKDNILPFLHRYSENNLISWSQISKDPDIDWTDDLITRYSHLWKWELLHENPSVKWSYKLIKDNEEMIHWNHISIYENIKWDNEAINRYKNKLKFSSKGVKPTPRVTNEKNKDVSISSLSNLPWSMEFIEFFESYWDWKELSNNTAIYWDEYLIDYFFDKLDFKILCTNPSVVWTEELIEKYYPYLYWDQLSGNPSLPWNLEFIKKYEENWKWYPDDSSKVAPYILDDKYYKPSLSTNSGILWDLQKLERYQRKLDFWRVALHGRLTEEAIMSFADKFDRSEEVGTKRHRHGDHVEMAKIYRNGWENLAKNPNIYINLTNIDFFLFQKNKHHLSKG
jgi:hypothetical protein